jgi:hypothetical protein
MYMVCILRIRQTQRNWKFTDASRRIYESITVLWTDEVIKFYDSRSTGNLFNKMNKYRLLIENSSEVMLSSENKFLVHGLRVRTMLML